MRVFGSDHNGQQTYITLRRMIRNYKVELHTGIMTWNDRVTELNSFLPFTPWKAGNTENKKPRSFNEEEMQEILSDAITDEQRLHLGNHNHDICMSPFSETIALLRNNEEYIRRQEQLKKNTHALMKKYGLDTSINENDGSKNGGGNSTKKNESEE